MKTTRRINYAASNANDLTRVWSVEGNEGFSSHRTPQARRLESYSNESRGARNRNKNRNRNRVKAGGGRVATLLQPSPSWDELFQVVPSPCTGEAH